MLTNGKARDRKPQGARTLGTNASGVIPIEKSEKFVTFSARKPALSSQRSSQQTPSPASTSPPPEAEVNVVNSPPLHCRGAGGPGAVDEKKEPEELVNGCMSWAAMEGEPMDFNEPPPSVPATIRPSAPGHGVAVPTPTHPSSTPANTAKVVPPGTKYVPGSFRKFKEEQQHNTPAPASAPAPPVAQGKKEAQDTQKVAAPVVEAPAAPRPPASQVATEPNGRHLPPSQLPSHPHQPPHAPPHHEAYQAKELPHKASSPRHPPPAQQRQPSPPAQKKEGSATTRSPGAAWLEGNVVPRIMKRQEGQPGTANHTATTTATTSSATSATTTAANNSKSRQSPQAESKMAWYDDECDIPLIEQHKPTKRCGWEDEEIDDLLCVAATKPEPAPHAHTSNRRSPEVTDWADDVPVGVPDRTSRSWGNPPQKAAMHRGDPVDGSYEYNGYPERDYRRRSSGRDRAEDNWNGEYFYDPRSYSGRKRRGDGWNDGRAWEESYDSRWDRDRDRYDDWDGRGRDRGQREDWDESYDYREPRDSSYGRSRDRWDEPRRTRGGRGGGSERGPPRRERREPRDDGQWDHKRGANGDDYGHHERPQADGSWRSSRPTGRGRGGGRGR